MPPGVRPPRRRRVRSQRGRQAARHRRGHVEVAGVQGAHEAARVARKTVMHPNEDAIHAYVDGSLGAAERTEIDRHVVSCASCRQLLEDLREILRATRALEPREPPVRVWQRLERAITLERDHAGPVARGSASGARGFQPSGGDSADDDARLKGSRSAMLAWLAAAAAVVLATVVGLRFMPSGRESVRTGAPATT